MAYVYQMKSGRWRVQIAKLGVRKSESFRTELEARNWGVLEEAKIVQTGGVEPTADKVGMQKTVGDLFDLWLDAKGANSDSGRWNTLRVGKWRKADYPLLSMPVGKVVPHDITAFKQALEAPRVENGRIKQLQPSSVTRELNMVSSAFTYAVKQLKWLQVNPCRDAEKPASTKARDRPLLTREELEAIQIAGGLHSDPQLRTVSARATMAFLLGLETGLRSGEMLRVRPLHYRRAERVLVVAAEERGGRKGSKSGKVQAHRAVPLTARAIEILDRMLETMPANQLPNSTFGLEKPPYIIGITDRQRDANWRKVRDAAGVRELTFHDNKHEACTRLSKYLDVIALSHAVGTKDIKLLRDTYYVNNAQELANLLPSKLATEA